MGRAGRYTMVIDYAAGAGGDPLPAPKVQIGSVRIPDCLIPAPRCLGLLARVPVCLHA